MFISYSTQAREALGGLAAYSTAAYAVALLRIQGELSSAPDGAMVESVVLFSLDDDEFVIRVVATAMGVEVAVHELDWQMRGI